MGTMSFKVSLPADNKKSLTGMVGLVQPNTVVNFKPPHLCDGFNVMNPNPCYLRVKINYDTDVDNNGDQTQIVPPMGELEVNMRETNLGENKNPIESIDVSTIDIDSVTTPVNVSGLPATALGAANAIVPVNFIES